MALLAQALELPEGFLEQRFSRPVANVRAVHYLRGQPSDPAKGIFGVGAHLPAALLHSSTPAISQKSSQVCVGLGPTLLVSQESQIKSP